MAWHHIQLVLIGSPSYNWLVKCIHTTITRPMWQCYQVTSFSKDVAFFGRDRTEKYNAMSIFGMPQNFQQWVVTINTKSLNNTYPFEFTVQCI